MVSPEPERPPIVDENTGLVFVQNLIKYTVGITDEQYRALMHYDCGYMDSGVTGATVAQSATITPAGVEIEIEAIYDNTMHRAIIARTIKWNIDRCVGQREKWGT